MIVRAALMIAVFAAAPLLAAAQTGAGAPIADAATPVAAAERAWATAVQGCNADAAGTLVTDDFTYTDFNGMTYSRAWFLKMVKACAQTTVRIEPMYIGLHDGDSSAIVLAKLHTFEKDTPVEIRHLTHVLVKENNAWRVAHHHSTVMKSNVGPSGDQYGLPMGGKAFTQLTGGPSAKAAEGFSPTVTRGPVGGAAARPGRIATEKDVMDAVYTYASSFQNCQTPTVDRLLAKDYLITGFNGMTYTRNWMIKGTEECYHDLQRIEPLQLRFYGENTAILLGRYHQVANNRAADLRHLTLVMVREGGEWRVALHHSTTFNENVGSAEGKLFYSEGGDSTLVSLPYPNRVHVKKK